MDTSEIYIGMCNCEEVQNQDCGGLYKMGTPFGDVLFYTNDKKGCSDDVWLPRQDQIQEMLISDDSWLDERRDGSDVKLPIRVGDSKSNYVL